MKKCRRLQKRPPPASVLRLTRGRPRRGRSNTGFQFIVDVVCPSSTGL
jgi:hypothetical protein